jgi:hypothetical protein
MTAVGFCKSRVFLANNTAAVSAAKRYHAENDGKVAAYFGVLEMMSSVP